MRRLLTIFMLLPFIGCCSSLNKVTEENTSFSFIQMSDPQLGFKEESGFEEGLVLLDKMVKVINETRPAFVIVTGDMTNSSKSEKQYVAYMNKLSQVSKDIPVYHIPGNHDISSSDAEQIAKFVKKYGAERFSFKYNGVAFIGINSCPIRDGAADIEAEQKIWLEKELGKAQNASQTYVFMHCPIVTKTMDDKETYSNFPIPKRREYLDLFKKYGVGAMFAGHLHQCFSCVLDGIEMVTCGPSGKPLGSGFPGYNLVTVTKEGYSYKYIAL